MAHHRQTRAPFLPGRRLTRSLHTVFPPQVQKLKVDSESAMLEIDQILKSNELSIALVAAVPAFLIAGGLLYWTSRWLGVCRGGGARLLVPGPCLANPRCLALP